MTPGFLRFEILSEVPPTVFNGLMIGYRIRAVAGIPMTWLTEIKHVIEGEQFVDEQRIGPFRFWFHEHRFIAASGGIEMIDRVHYVMRGGALGALAHALFVRKRLESIFAFRRQFLDQRFPR